MVDDAISVHHESVDAGFTIFHRPGDQGKARDHVTVDDIVEIAAGNVVTLPGKHLVAVAKIAGILTVTILFEIDEWAGWAWAQSLTHRPIQAVCLTLAAD